MCLFVRYVEGTSKKHCKYNQISIGFERKLYYFVYTVMMCKLLNRHFFVNLIIVYFLVQLTSLLKMYNLRENVQSPKGPWTLNHTAIVIIKGIATGIIMYNFYLKFMLLKILSIVKMTQCYKHFLMNII